MAQQKEENEMMIQSLSTSIEKQKSESKDNLDRFLTRYLKVLDKSQQEVYDIRIAHHQIWRDSRTSDKIIQHRAGSRVESQTRILPQGKDTDVDYMFELNGISVCSNDNEHKGNMYWKPSECPIFGSIYVMRDNKKYLEQKFDDIFNNSVFEWDTVEEEFLIIPKQFKENVVNASYFEFSKDKLNPTTSPSVPGKGVVNEYDTVPCLRLRTWPSEVLYWTERFPYDKESVVSRKWRNSVVQNISLFLVPTGNPLSKSKSKQFRLSFSMVEVQFFHQLTPIMRQCYGIAKYIFKKLFYSRSCELLSSFHIKTLFMWLVEECDIKEWDEMTPMRFILIMLKEIECCVLNKAIRHFFYSDYNTFPLHKVNDENVSFYYRILQCKEVHIKKAVTELLHIDLRIPPKSDNSQDIVMASLDHYDQLEYISTHINGYLTRLLSMITFSLYENELTGTLVRAVENIRCVFDMYPNNKYLEDIIYPINVFLARNSIVLKSPPNKNLSVSDIGHMIFKLYLDRKLGDVDTWLKDFNTGNDVSTGGIGISVSKYDKAYELDIPLRFVIQELEERYNGVCPRFYVDPILMINHIKVQNILDNYIDFSLIPGNILQRLQKYISEMEKKGKQIV